MLPDGGPPRFTPFDVDPDAYADGNARAAAWTRELSRRLSQREPSIRRHRAYFAGEQPMRLGSKNWTDAFGDSFGCARNNWMPLVAETAVARIDLQGFRLDPRDPNPDRDAWEIFQANGLDLHAAQLHLDTIVTGWGYTLTWPDEHDDPRITVEDPLETIVMRDPADRRRILAGLKSWRDLVGRWHALLFTPDTVWTLVGGIDGSDERTAIPPQQWTVTKGEDNPLGRVPIVEFINNPDIHWQGHSDLEPVEPLQDALDKTFADLLIASEFTAYRQRVLIGGETPIDPTTKQPITQAEFGIQRLLTLEEGGEIKELEASDLSNYTGVLESLKNDVAALTWTPPQYLLGSMVNISGDALKAAESGLYFRVARKLKLFGESWKATLRLAFHVLGLEEMAMTAEVVWRDHETTSEAVRVDALTKLSTLEVPKVALWEMWGATPTMIERWKAERIEEQIAGGYALGLTPNGPAVEPAAPEPLPEPIAA
ncbi:hypothetical protein PAI11_37450 [Patulibacter medicamentivorans]|uniref:Phage portal protein n=2 Tax=Patulibacter medicamentivorans TaxID=1097667 RepID=H0EA71_9ACTN|nr:hypothetical protein PAI11_37450 [Patulibacter medicamentivorans]